MKIYSDEALTIPITAIEFGAVQAGDIKDVTVYVKNDSLAELKNLKFTLDNPEISIVKAPENLKPWGIDTLIVRWNVKVDLRKGLKAKININAEEYWSNE